MLRTLIKKQFAEIFRTYFYDQRKNKARSKGSVIAWFLFFILIMGGVIFAWYMLGCGTNYYRYEFSAFSGLKVQKSSVDELEGLCTELAVKAAAAREEAAAKAVENGSMTAKTEVYNSYLSQKELKEAARSAMYALAERYLVMKGYFPKPKAVFFSRVMSEFNFTGV